MSYVASPVNQPSERIGALTSQRVVVADTGLDQLSTSVGSFGIRCGLGWVLGVLAGTISSWEVPEENAKNTRKM